MAGDWDDSEEEFAEEDDSGLTRHQCLVYDGDPSEQLPAVVPMFLEGLAKNERCLYLGAPPMIGMIEAALESAGVDVAAASAAGGLILSTQRPPSDGCFNPTFMVSMLEDMIDAAVRDGFAGLCATGDMRWELGGDTNFGRLREYETLLEEVFMRKPLHGICQYHRDSVPPAALEDALETHRTIHLGPTRFRENPFYLPPRLRPRSGERHGPRGERGAWMLGELHRALADEQERERRNADALLNGMLTLSRIARQEITLESLDLTLVAAGVAGELRALAPHRAVSVAIAPGLAARGDFTLVRTALQQLLDNAWKFTAGRADARITLEQVETADGYTTFCVSDNGAGFGMEHKDRLFTLFQRLHPRNEFPGAGVGLAAVARIIERHGGRVWAEGEPGRGARFYFTLPEAGQR